MLTFSFVVKGDAAYRLMQASVLFGLKAKKFGWLWFLVTLALENSAGGFDGQALTQENDITDIGSCSPPAGRK